MRSTRDFLIGTLTGLTIGLLSAPRTGEESRRLLKQAYDKRMGSSSGSSSPDLQERLTTLFDQLKEQINNYIGQRNNHKKRLKDTGHFDYQVERQKKFTKQVASSPAGPSTTEES
ncbi:MAG TPA: YtxH domain-containing protein [Spirosoma sp.]|jgi:gas vesicle protein|nr:YtxH domain-containing protein [Spirosoma sp.]